MAPFLLTTEQMSQITADRVQGKDIKRRGINVYTISELLGVTGWAKDGKQISGFVERGLFTLTLMERLDIFKLNSDVFGVVTSRMNRIAGLDWTVTRDSYDQDRVEIELRSFKQLFSEYKQPTDMKEAVIKGRSLQNIRLILPDVKDDLSNFENALLRWKRRNKTKDEDHTSEVEDWLREPNITDNFDDFIKKSVFDLMVHGSLAIYKEKDPEDNRLDNFYVLPGGTTFPLRSRFAGGGNAFAQIIPGIDPRIYYQDEIWYSSYVPSSATSYGHVPLEALVNKIAESLLFDRRSAEQADGTKPPEKVIIFGDKSPFGDLGQQDQYGIPIPKEEQDRLETAINEPRKEAIRTLTGTGTPLVLDMSRADVFPHQQARQDKIREAIALVFNMSNMEVNLTGSADTSGRATSETQERIEREKGIWPIVKMLQERLNKDIIPQRFGTGYKFEFNPGLSEAEQLRMDREKVQSRTYSVNEVRVARGDEPYPEEEFDKPQGGTPFGPPLGTPEEPVTVEMKE